MFAAWILLFAPTLPLNLKTLIPSPRSYTSIHKTLKRRQAGRGQTETNDAHDGDDADHCSTDNPYYFEVWWTY